ncbi:hypothetical protein [Pseudomonas leptonychotis]|uniref:hypothetical protein n=1 Tax=Pseudomonas leptonychotis TaxID=2448482 RepID=UPI00386EFB51
MTTKRSSTQIVLEAVQDLHTQEQVVTRETLAALTGLKLSVIDDRVGALIDDEQVVRVQRGVYVPAETHPPARVISKTLLPDGTSKIDIGDQVLTLTPKEDRMLAQLLAGVAMQTAAIEVGRQAGLQTGELSGRLNKIERDFLRNLESDTVTERDASRSDSVTGRDGARQGESAGAARARAYRKRKKLKAGMTARDASRSDSVTPA